ncbi:DUF2624 domain-containing protein [Amphibacillus sp. MSJ-3]|uniref:DUF2624 family protein n=1 Tax=Amphibacillus sp. MSJ-3 TaxID=2841505 RepID=UPI001C0EDAF1|nr:DUF2624 family protein [Amphibacillus sp. MSJ-3]MBU5595736.1 DUF2624 domain-containing protein [Amphibacillus sp. MSJ-3]
MNQIFKQVIRKKMTEITPDELLTHAEQYQVALSQAQAVEIIKIINTQKFDPFKKEDLIRMFDHLERITDQATVKQAKIILNQFIKQYNLADWFY